MQSTWLKMNNHKLLYLSKNQIINLLIVIVWFIFFLLNWITYSRIMLFLEILEIIVIYRIIWKHLINLDIQNVTLLKYLNLLNKYKNPLLLCLIKIDVLMYDIIISYNYKILNSIIYILYIILFNPLKIFFFKF